MKKFLSTFFAFFISIPGAFASVIDGINVGPAGSNVFQIGSIWEGLVSTPGQHLQGIGFIDSIKLESDSTILWQSGDNSRQLGFTFDYILASINVITPTISQYNFTTGVLQFYSMANGTFESDGNLANDISKIQAGQLFLDLTGANFTGTVVGSPTVFTGLGSGFLDVIGNAGSANAVFDTDSKFDGSIFHDMLFNSSFTTSAPGTFYPIVGSIDIYGNTNEINEPKPLSLLLLGLGLIGIGSYTNKKKFKFNIA